MHKAAPNNRTYVALKNSSLKAKHLNHYPLAIYPTKLFKSKPDCSVQQN